MRQMNILITGCAGFIGHGLSKLLLSLNLKVTGIDNFSDYYSKELKGLRLKDLQPNQNFRFYKYSVRSMERVFKKNHFDAVIHLAAQPGVRLPRNSYSKYVDANLIDFIKFTMLINKYQIPIFLYASSSSVYGRNSTQPFHENETNLKPSSFYATTKLMNEIYSEGFFDQEVTKHIGMRFFTVYGPFGRPDMSYFRLLNSALNEEPFKLYGDGNQKRDFTYIADVQESIYRILVKLNQSSDDYPSILNIGGGKPISMLSVIEQVESITQKKIKIIRQEGSNLDMKLTQADFQNLSNYISFEPKTSFHEGITRTLDWIEMNNLRKNLKLWVNSTA
jgi:UDP-glucuronate 4-epimerase